jgi:hypothetical protein
MSWRDAPLYVEAHDLAAWLLARTASWDRSGAACLAPRIANASCELVESIALALTFPPTRRSHLERADASIVVLRTELRLARALEIVSARRLRFACERLRTIGRMVGGWRKRVERGSSRRGAGWREEVPGDGPPAAGSV